MSSSRIHSLLAGCGKNSRQLQKWAEQGQERSIRPMAGVWMTTLWTTSLHEWRDADRCLNSVALRARVSGYARTRLIWIFVWAHVAAWACPPDWFGCGLRIWPWSTLFRARHGYIRVFHLPANIARSTCKYPLCNPTSSYVKCPPKVVD